MAASLISICPLPARSVVAFAAPTFRPLRMICCSLSRAASVIWTPAILNRRTPQAAKTVARMEPKPVMAHVRTWPASVPTLMVVVLATGPVVVTVFWVTAGAGLTFGIVDVGAGTTPGTAVIVAGEGCALAIDGAMARKATANRWMIFMSLPFVSPAPRSLYRVQNSSCRCRRRSLPPSPVGDLRSTR